MSDVILGRAEISRGLRREVVSRVENYDVNDGDTEGLIETLVDYIVSGWWALCGGDLSEWENIVLEHRKKAVAFMCSIVSMAHALRSGEIDRWTAEQKKAPKRKDHNG